MKSNKHSILYQIISTGICIFLANIIARHWLEDTLWWKMFVLAILVLFLHILETTLFKWIVCFVEKRKKKEVENK